MQIIYKNIKDIKKYKNNPRKNELAVEKVAESIKEFGFRNPILIDKGNEIVCGHTRYDAAKKLGIKEVPCIIADDLTPEQIKAFRLVDNKTNEFAEWDDELLDLEIQDIEIDLSPFGFEKGLDKLPDEVIEDEFDGELPTEPTSKLGDIYKLGNHRLMCGDSTKKEDVDKLMNGNKADMVLSDPPYGMKLDTDYSSMTSERSFHKGKTHNKVIGDNEDFKPELITTFFENFNCGEVFLFGADYFAELLPNKNEGSWLVWDKRKESQADGFGSEFELIWSKRKHKRRVLRHDWFGFFSSENAKDAQNRVHPTQKPVTLLADIINQWGGGVQSIVDLYGGSGSTLIACEQLNRICYMMELDPRYCDVIIQRYIAFKGTSDDVYRINEDGTKTKYEDIT